MTPPTQTAEAGKFRLIPRNIDFATWWDRVGILAVLAIGFAGPAFAQSQSCNAQAAEKKLAGAARRRPCWNAARRPPLTC